MPTLERSPLNGYTCPTDPGEPGTNRPRLSINDQEGRILQALLRGLKVLEIGTGLGVSTRKIAAVAEAVHTIDPDPWVIAEIAPWLPANVLALPALPPIRGYFDAAFIDGLHTFQQVSADIASVRSLVKPGGLIVLHDLYIQGVIAALVDAHLPFVHLQTTAGMALAWNETEDPSDE